MDFLLEPIPLLSYCKTIHYKKIFNYLFFPWFTVIIRLRIFLKQNSKDTITLIEHC
jgi:hypothetical protein